MCAGLSGKSDFFPGGKKSGKNFFIAGRVLNLVSKWKLFRSLSLKGLAFTFEQRKKPGN